jgi:hypothetical protein
MLMFVRSCVGVLAFVLAIVPAAAAERAGAGESTAVDFSRDVKPILAEHCLKCHGNDKAEAGLNLGDRISALKELETGTRAVVPGKSVASELISRVTTTDVDLRMPPGDEKPLSAREIDVLRRWIDAGAEYQTHWSFRPLTKPAAPATADKAWGRSPIDAFVLQKLEERKIEPSPEADPHTLIKRVHLDLTGLLPTTDEVEKFVREYSAAKPDAKERLFGSLVDRLLASPHFGERWGRHWLDLARYADSDGYEKDNPRPDAYVFRDWVIKAFNENLPFGRFTTEQLAGDLLPQATPQQKIATAFNRQTLTNTEGGTDQEEFRVAACMDRTDTLGSVWLGLTVGCAKCHTHKYDPIAHSEYYRLFAFFNGSDEVVQKLPVKAKDLDLLNERLRPLQDALEARYKAITPAEQKWEEEQTQLVNFTKSTPLKVETLDVVAEVSAASGAKFEKQKDGSYLVAAAESVPPSSTNPLPSGEGRVREVGDKSKLEAALDAPSPQPSPKGRGSKKQPPTAAHGDVDVYTLTLDKLPADLTGLRLETVVDDALPKKSAARSDHGNFVVTQFRAEVIDAAGKKLRDLPLQRATADFEQTGFKAADALTASTNSKKGWAVVPQVDKPHWLQVRTMQAVTLAADERLRVVIEQNYGTRHTLGRFRVRAVTGDARDLHLPTEVVNGLKLYAEKRTYETRQRLFDFFAKDDPEVKRIQAEIEAVNKEFQTQLMPVRMIATSRRDRKTFRFDRGDFLAPQEQVQPGGFAVLPPLKADGSTATRLDLAKWLTGPANPLTPRVIANQFWARLFGNGIVRSVGDFGVRGELPSHPELLDWLAVTYRDDLKWDTKAYLKTILMSSTYRQSSAHRPELVDVDPLNTLLARQNRLRVEAEIVRDLALEVGGLLSPKIGGPSVFPPMPSDLAKLSYANNFSWSESTGEDRYRRGMYTFFKRTIPHPTLMTFDCPDANLTCVIRSVSNTPLQALTLLNNDAFVESSQALAKKLLTIDDLDDEKRLAMALRMSLVREPETEEIERLETLLDHARKYYANQPDAATALVGSYAAPPIPAAETAAWIATLRVLLNLDEFITRE